MFSIVSCLFGSEERDSSLCPVLITWRTQPSIGRRGSSKPSIVGDGVRSLQLEELCIPQIQSTELAQCQKLVSVCTSRQVVKQ